MYDAPIIRKTYFASEIMQQNKCVVITIWLKLNAWIPYQNRFILCNIHFWNIHCTKLILKTFNSLLGGRFQFNPVDLASTTPSLWTPMSYKPTIGLTKHTYIKQMHLWLTNHSMHDIHQIPESWPTWPTRCINKFYLATYMIMKCIFYIHVNDFLYYLTYYISSWISKEAKK